MPENLDLARERELDREKHPHYVLGLRAGRASVALVESGYRNLRWLDGSDPSANPGDRPANDDHFVVAQFPHPSLHPDRRPPRRATLLLVTSEAATVPNLLGMTLAEALLTCEEAGLTLRLVEGPSSPSARVRTQTPEGGAEVAKGSTVYVISWIPR